MTGTVFSLSRNERLRFTDLLKSMKSEERIKGFENVLNSRTRYFSVLMENISHAHNSSAVMRSCDCFGIQDVHLVDDNNYYPIHKDVTMGASKWLTLKRYYKSDENSAVALKALKDKGYRIVATTPRGDANPLFNFDIKTGPALFVFGTELTGISDVVMDYADEFLTIPTTGFTQSLNLSVSVALILHHVTAGLYSSDTDWNLTDEEKEVLMLEWLIKSTPKVDLIEKRFLQTI
ncbi:RNA methyltransferase [Marinilabiliaceae bacterium ANBcel2]|nr:RNA methyltransferase [Marinilabiliaceae bacterium ANBcel2]